MDNHQAYYAPPVMDEYLWRAMESWIRRVGVTTIKPHNEFILVRVVMDGKEIGTPGNKEYQGSGSATRWIGGASHVDAEDAARRIAEHQIAAAMVAADPYFAAMFTLQASAFRADDEKRKEHG